MNRLNKTTLLGLILVIVGMVTVLSNFGAIPWYIRHYIFQWENILILIGLFLLISDENRKVGGILVAIGLVLVIDDWFRIHVSIWDMWPLALVFLGLYIISRRNVPTNDFNANQSDDTDLIEDTAVFSGGDKVITSRNFKGGHLTAIFGGSNIDLTTSTLSPESANIEVLYIFGGSKIRVPKEWNVELKVTNIFGGLSDKRAVKDYDPEVPEKLYIRGLILFGGAEITN